VSGRLTSKRDSSPSVSSSMPSHATTTMSISATTSRTDHIE
jgi:hypothetical protein